jgi:glycolate oxidase FAD binding subunit
MESPADGNQVAELLVEAASQGDVIVPVGGGGALALGNLITRDAVGLSTRKLNRVIDYQPTDMTLSVGAGATLDELNSVIESKGQSLPIETIDPGVATIGGLIATALTGPRKYGGGSLRDVLIGISVAYPDGTIGKAGGLVVKNVSGFDMMRLHYGALGTLGVILSANFKVLPTIRNEFTAIWAVEQRADVETICDELRSPRSRPTALVACFEGDAWSVAARYEGRPGGLTAVRLRLDSGRSPDTYLESDDSRQYWQTLLSRRALDNREDIIVRFGARPTRTFAIVDDLISEHAPKLQAISVEPGLGQILVKYSAVQVRTSDALLSVLNLTEPGLNATVLTAPDAIKSGLDVWGAEPDTIEIMRRLKSEFDPVGVLNRHRFAGNI